MTNNSSHSVNLIAMIRRQLFPLFVILLLSACQSLVADTDQTLYISNELVDCYGVTPQKCMLVKSNLNDEWEFFYDIIAGFQYQKGYAYKLLVKSTPVEDPAQDASSIAYELIEVIEKTCIAC